MDFRKTAYLPLEYNLFDSTFQFNPMGAVYFGFGVVSDIGEKVKELGGSKAIVITDKGIVDAELLPRVTEPLEKAGITYTVFDEVEPNPSSETVHKAAEIAKGCDIIIGLGGGSPIDTAKAAGILVTNGGKIEDYEGINMYKNAIPPLIAVPTTSGTGTEVTPFAVITDTKTEWKMAIGNAYSIPSLAICDPELTMTLPPKLTAGTGMDALTHAVESYTSFSNNPIAEALAKQSIQLAAKSLRAAVGKGDTHKQARYDMMMSSTIAGAAFTTTILGIGHSMAHPLGGIFNIDHGTANGIMLPIIMEFNLTTNPEKFRDIAVLMGENIDNLSLMDAAKKSVEAVRNLGKDVGIPTLSDLGVKESDVPRLAEEAMKGGDRWTNPRNTTIEDFHYLYKKAL